MSKKMLPVEVIKWGCEFVDGCNVMGNGRVNMFDRNFMSFDNSTDPVDIIDFYTSIYPLFLQRVIEGINIEVNYRIKQEDNILDVYLCDDFGDIKSIKQIGADTPDQAKAQAIQYIFDHREDL